MINSEFIKFDYLNFLCEKNLHNSALYFALYLNLPNEQYPFDLKQFWQKLSTENFEEIRQNVEKFIF